MMSGMLVQVTPGGVDKAEQAITTLFGVDPDFVTLCKTLYGADVDPVDVWVDVFKDNPTGPDLHVPGDLNSRRGRKRALEAAGIGATVIGGALGVKDIGEQRAELREAKMLGTGVLKPRVRIAGVSTMLGGDAAATANQLAGRKQRKAQTAVASKAVAKVGVGALADGFEAGMRKLPGIGGLSPKLPTASPKLPTKPLKPTKPAVAKNDELDVVWAGEFSKFDEDKRLVFGWASVVELNGTPVIDRQGDYIHPDDLENASYEYVIKSRVGGDMHRRDPGDLPLKISDLVESVVFTPEKIEKMGLPRDAASKIPTGWWVGFKVHSDKAWDEVKKGAKAGFSIHGRGKRVPTEVDAIMPGYH